MFVLRMYYCAIAVCDNGTTFKKNLNLRIGGSKKFRNWGLEKNQESGAMLFKIQGLGKNSEFGVWKNSEFGGWKKMRIWGLEKIRGGGPKKIRFQGEGWSNISRGEGGGSEFVSFPPVFLKTE